MRFHWSHFAASAKTERATVPGWKGSAGSEPRSSVTLTLGPGGEEKPGLLDFCFGVFF